MDQNDERFSSRSEYFEALEDISTNPSNEPTLGDLINRRFNRRELLKGTLGVAAMGVLARVPLITDAEAAATDTTAGQFAFQEIAHGADETHHVAPGYSADVLMRWGDRVTVDAPAFDPLRHSAAAQLKQYGYNNDFIGFVPLPYGSNNSDHGLLCVNHEYTDEELMFPGYGKHDRAFSKVTREIVDIEMASHGGSVFEVKKQGGKWRVVSDSRYARRISALAYRNGVVRPRGRQ